MQRSSVSTEIGWPVGWCIYTVQDDVGAEEERGRIDQTPVDVQ
jgi:hypothetical protein